MLWQELKELERHCEVRIESYLAPVTRALRWKATIRPRDGSSPPVMTDHPEIAEAVREAVELAIQRGWGGAAREPAG